MDACAIKRAYVDDAKWIFLVLEADFCKILRLFFHVVIDEHLGVIVVFLAGPVREQVGAVAED